MFKSILSVLGGAAIGVFTIGLVQYMSVQLFPVLSVPIVLGMSSDSFFTERNTALLFITLGFAISSFFGGMVAARVSSYKPLVHATLVGLLLLAMGFANLLPSSYPVWFKTVSLLIFLPMAYFGGMMSVRRIP